MRLDRWRLRKSKLTVFDPFWRVNLGSWQDCL